MQFVVAMELFGTVVLPAAMILTVLLIVSLVTSDGPFLQQSLLPLLTLLLVLFVPAILIVFATGRLVYLLWLIVYLLALPIWNLILPLYAFWHFDDFSWGKTREVTGGEDLHGKKTGEFDPNSIQMRRLADWERMLPMSTPSPPQNLATPSINEFGAQRRRLYSSNINLNDQ
jgi:chitin synthase